MAARHHHHVYVVLLSQDVLYEPKFKKCNPNYDTAKPCVYVGMPFTPAKIWGAISGARSR